MTTKTAPLTAKERLIVALDVESLDEARRWMDELREEVGLFKIGLELYARYGTALFDVMKQDKIPFFFDCKFHDIPNTVAGASRPLVGQGMYMFNVHATGGSEMMRAAMTAVTEEAQKKSVQRPLIISVTILTSISKDILINELGVSQSVEETVVRLAKLSQTAGLDGVVCSAQEAEGISKACGPDFLIVTPGIRPAWSAGDDQKRIVTPAQAMKNGSTHIVVGRPITREKNKADAARRIVEEMSSAL